MRLATINLVLGLLADGLTFAGTVVLALDSLRRRRELKALRVNAQFQAENPELRLRDRELQFAAESADRALLGTSLVAAGFFLQILVRLLAP